jgi:hypothetical protein
MGSGIVAPRAVRGEQKPYVRDDIVRAYDHFPVPTMRLGRGTAWVGLGALRWCHTCRHSRMSSDFYAVVQFLFIATPFVSEDSFGPTFLTG